MDPILNLYNNSIRLLEKGDRLELRRNLDVFQTLLTRSLEESTKPQQSRFIRKLNEYLKQIFEKLAEKREYEILRDSVINLLEASQTRHASVAHEQRFIIDLESVLYMLLRQMREVDNAETLRRMGLLEIFAKLFTYTRMETPMLYETYFRFLIDSKIQEANVKKHLVLSYLRHILTLEYRISTEEIFVKGELYKKIILRTFRAIIAANDLSYFSLFIDMTFSIGRIKRHGKVKVDSIIVILTVYLYYLAFIEEYVKKEEREVYRKFLYVEENGDSLFDLYRSQVDHLWDYYLDVKKELERDWEIFKEGEAKFLKMGHCINEFFVFSTCMDSWVLPSLMKEINRDVVLSEENLYQFLSFFRGKSLREEYQKGYQTFCEWLDYPLTEDATSKFATFLLSEYKKLRIQEVFELDTERIMTHQEVIRAQMLAGIESRPFVLNALRKKDQDGLLSVFLIQDYLPAKFLEQDSSMGETFLELTIRRLEDYVFSLLRKKGAAHLSLTYSMENKAEHLWRKLKFAEKQGVRFDSVYQSADLTNRSFFYQENSEQVERLKQREEQMESFLLQHLFRVIYVDRSKVQFQYAGAKVAFRPLDTDEVGDYVTRYQSGDEYMIPLVNEASAPFSREEAESYIRAYYVHFEVSVSISVEMRDQAGAFIVEYVV